MYYLTHIEEDHNWSMTANCYAYACDQRTTHIRNGRRCAVPGGTHHNPAFPIAGDNTYADRLVRGAMRDGLTLLSRGNPANLHLHPCPRGHYRVALFANKVGFHWLRHDEVLDRWSWKSGNGGPVYYNVFNNRDGIKRTIYVKNEYLESINQDTHKTDILSAEINNMDFIAYFAVPNGGLAVSA
ncbi:hypothetical protein [Vibrio sp.]|uniref:hypothetical protein n=1 Tax=Vibrio sp. TaxID=678 RepID=UPI00311F6F66